MSTECWLDNLKGRDHWQGLGVDGRAVLQWVVGSSGGMVWIKFMGIGYDSKVLNRPVLSELNGRRYLAS